jgi:two-component system chemotaxis sensor kinase CheA
MIVPITAAVQRVLVVGVGDQRVALPVSRIERIHEVPVEAVEDAGGESFTLVDDDPVLVLELADAVRIPAKRASARAAQLVMIELRGERVALRVDRFVGQQEIYIKPVPELLSNVKLLAGMTVLEDGSPIFLLDLNHIA